MGNRNLKGKPTKAGMSNISEIDWSKYPEANEHVRDLVETALRTGNPVPNDGALAGEDQTLAKQIVAAHAQSAVQPAPAQPTTTAEPTRFAKATAYLKQLTADKVVRAAGKVAGAIALVAAGALGTLIYKSRGGA